MFQEKEWIDELDLAQYDSEWRRYDPYGVRTTTMDPHAELYPEISPYSFLDNNPVNTLDPTGMDAIDLNENYSDNNFDQFNNIAICPTCPNTPEFKPYIDDPNNTYYYDENSKAPPQNINNLSGNK